MTGSLSVQIEAALGRAQTNAVVLTGVGWVHKFLNPSVNLQIVPNGFGINLQAKLGVQDFGNRFEGPSTLSKGSDQFVVRLQFAARRLWVRTSQKVSYFLFEVHSSAHASTMALHGAN